MSARVVVSALLAIAVGAGAGCTVDPVHSDAVDALGPESARVRPGPDHRPGQPCLTCHGSSGPARPEFSVAGTVFKVKGSTDPLEGAHVELTDADNRTYATVTNAAGNFYIGIDRWVPHYPMHVKLTYGGATQEMTTHVGRDGSCAGCHHDPEGTASPGGVYFALTPNDLPEGP